MAVLLTISVVLAVLVALVIYRIFVWPRFKYAWADRIPGPPKHWLYGTVHHTKPGRQSLLDHLGYSQKYGPIARMWVGPVFPLIALYHPEAAQVVLRETQPKGSFYRYMNDWLGWSVLTSAGDDWKRKRRMLTPAFHFKVLEGYQEIFHNKLHELIEKWDVHAHDGSEVDVCLDITHTTLDIIGQCAFTYDIGALRSGRRVAYVSAIYSAMDLVYRRTFNPFHTNDLVYSMTKEGKELREHLKVIQEFVTRVIVNRKEELETQMKEEGVDTVEELIEESGKKPSFIDILFSSTDADGKPLSIQEIRDETNTFMFEGHDTTSSGISWVLYFLAENQDVQEKVYQEAKEALGDSPHAEIPMLNKLPYLKAVVDEALRLCPPIPVISREMPEDMEICGYLVPKGAQVMVHPWVIHHQPDVWENPDKFDPERFSVEGRRNQGAYDHVPFSAGPRNCIGQKFAVREELTIISGLIKRYKIELAPSDEKVLLHPTLVSRPLYEKSQEPYRLVISMR